MNYTLLRANCLLILSGQVTILHCASICHVCMVYCWCRTECKILFIKYIKYSCSVSTLTLSACTYPHGGLKPMMVVTHRNVSQREAHIANAVFGEFEPNHRRGPVLQNLQVKSKIHKFSVAENYFFFRFGI